MRDSENRTTVRSIVRFAVVIVIGAWMLADAVPSISRIWAPLGTFGYTADADGRVTSVAASSAAANAGLRVGDRFAVASVPIDQRRFVLGPLFLTSRPGIALTLPVSTPSGSRQIAMTSSAERLSVADKLLVFARAFGAVFFVVVGAALVLLRPSPMTWALFFFTIGLNPGSDATFDSFLPSGWYPVNWFLIVWSMVAGAVGFLTFALRFPHVGAGWRRALSRMTPVLFAAFALYGSYCVIAPYLYAQPGETATRWLYGFAALCFAAGLISLGATFFNEHGENRQRIKWVLVGCLIGLPAYTIGGVFDLTSVFPMPPYWVICALLSLNLLIPTALAYAVIRHRVIDVTFVISRALVYGVLTSILVVAFALVDWVLGRQLSSSGLAVVVEVGITIAFAFWLNAIHHRVDRFVDRTLFRARHLAERRIERVAHALPHARSNDLVAELLVREPADALGLASAAVFRRADDERFVREMAVGWSPETTTEIYATDTLVLHLESEQAPIAVHELRWQRDDLPRGAAHPQLAVPIVVRKRLLGFALYGAHTGGVALDPDEIAIIGSLMTGASAAYDHLDAEAMRRESDAMREQAASLARRVAELETELDKARASAQHAELS
ncbi:MAG TPA: hypothetical protein VID24_02280 [Candidatus Eremiobacteraceae bacterium]|jgi:hypothetical protein